MYSTLSILAYAAAVVAAPVAEDAGAIKVPLVQRNLLTRANGHVDAAAFLQNLNATLNKYHSKAVVPDFGGLLSGILAKRNNLHLTDQVITGEDLLYYGPASVGATTPQTFTIDFDTGSADFFVPGPSCGKAQGCVGTTKYDQGGTNRKTTTSVTYGSGSISGNDYYDSVSVAGLTASNTNVVSLTSAQGFSTSASEGLMGMGFSTIAQSGQPTFFENLISQGKVATHEFSFFLGRHGTSTVGQSELTLGGRDASKYTGGFTTVPVTTKGYWQVKVDGASVSGGPSLATTAGQAAIDTGTTIILAPTVAATTIFAQIPGSLPVPLVSGSPTVTIFAFPCATKSTVSLIFAGKKFQINPKDLSLGVLTTGLGSIIGNPALTNLLLTPLGLSGGICLASIAGDDISPTQSLYVVGDSFLKNWYATFNYNGPSVDFAKAI